MYTYIPFLREDLFDLFLVLGDNLKLVIENLNSKEENTHHVHVRHLPTVDGGSWSSCAYQ